jgi:hypothetical protein
MAQLQSGFACCAWHFAGVINYAITSGGDTAARECCCISCTGQDLWAQRCKCCIALLLLPPADLDACQGSPCNSQAHAVSGSCVDLPAPSTGYACSCSAGWVWDSNSASCAGARPRVNFTSKLYHLMVKDKRSQGPPTLDLRLCMPKQNSYANLKQ